MGMVMTPLMRSMMIMASIPLIKPTNTPSEPEPEPIESLPKEPVRESRQVRRARERAERKAL